MADLIRFKLVRDAREPVVNQLMQRFYVVDLNGDKVPDRVEIVRQNDQVGFQVKWGEFTKLDPAVVTKGQQKFFEGLGATAVLSYMAPQKIWETPVKTPTEIVNFELKDLNGDNDIDISFTLSQISSTGDESSAMGAFLLMNQTNPDPVIFSMDTPPEPSEPNLPPPGHKEKPARGQFTPTKGIPG